MLTTLDDRLLTIRTSRLISYYPFEKKKDKLSNYFDVNNGVYVPYR